MKTAFFRHLFPVSLASEMLFRSLQCYHHVDISTFTSNITLSWTRFEATASDR